jgi:hypothetical protein
VDSDEKKVRPPFTAVKTGPIGQTILVPTDEVADYEALVDAVNRQFRPDTYTEQLVAQSVVDYEWRLRRISKMQEGLYLLGRRELAGRFAAELDVETREAMIEAEVPNFYRKELNNLARQERFLRKQLKLQTAELNQMVRKNPKSKRRGLFLVPKRTI